MRTYLIARIKTISRPGNLAVLALSYLLLTGCSETEDKKVKTPHGPFLGLTATETPQLLTPGFLATALDEYNGTFSPDGTEFYYTLDTPDKGIIAYTQMLKDGSWSAPAVASFSGSHSEYDPIFTPDGNRLYFSSRRPLKDSLSAGKSNIWFLNRQGDGWSEPIPLVLSDRDDYYSSVTNEGAIYYNTWSTGDIYKATLQGMGFVSKALDSTINRGSDKGDPFVSPEEDYLIFRGYGEESLGRGDLFISFRIADQWTTPENLGPVINSVAHEMCPWVSPDQKLFIFASSRLQKPYSIAPEDSFSELQEKYESFDNGNLNIYVMKADFIDRLRKKYMLQSEEE